MLGPGLFTGGLLTGKSKPALGWCMSHVPSAALPHKYNTHHAYTAGVNIQLNKLSWFLTKLPFSYLDTLSILTLCALGEALLVFKQISARRLVCHDNSANPQHDGLMGLIASCPTGANAPTTTHPRVPPRVLPLTATSDQKPLRAITSGTIVGPPRWSMWDHSTATSKPL